MCPHREAAAPLTLSFTRHFVKLGHLSQLVTMADALIDVVICSVESLRVPSVSPDSLIQQEFPEC